MTELPDTNSRPDPLPDVVLTAEQYADLRQQLARLEGVEQELVVMRDNYDSERQVSSGLETRITELERDATLAREIEDKQRRVIAELERERDRLADIGVAETQRADAAEERIAELEREVQLAREVRVDEMADERTAALAAALKRANDMLDGDHSRDGVIDAQAVLTAALAGSGVEVVHRGKWNKRDGLDGIGGGVPCYVVTIKGEAKADPARPACSYCRGTGDSQWRRGGRCPKCLGTGEEGGGDD